MSWIYSGTPRLRMILALCVVCWIIFDVASHFWNSRTTRRAGVQLLQVSMGTLCTLTLYENESRNRQVLKLTGDTMRAIEQDCSLFLSESELARLNRSAAQKPFACSEMLWQILVAAREAHRISGGVFDVSAKPLMELWGIYRRRDEIPSDAEVAEVLKRVGLDKVRFDDAARTVFFTVPGMALDLGGLAKGYAVDRAVEVLMADGVTRGVVNLGGNLRTLPMPPPGRSIYRVDLRDPLSMEAMEQPVELLGNSVATSGHNERSITLGGRRVSHIMNPLTGYPVDDHGAVTVVTPLALDADLFSTICLIQGYEWCVENRSQLPRNSRVLFYSERGTVREVRSANDGVAGK